MTPQERQARIQYLEQLGVPRQYQDAIIDAPTTRMMRWGGPVLALALIGLIILVMSSTFFWLTGHVEARAAEVAAQTGATITHADVGLGPLVLLFGLLALIGWAGCVVACHHRVAGFRSSVAGMLNPGPNQKGSTKLFLRWMMERSVRRAASRSQDIDSFLHATAQHQARRWLIAAVVLLTPAIAFTALETNSFWVAGPTSVVEHRMFPPFFSRRHDLKDVSKVVTGCNHTDKVDRLIYDIHFPSGERFSLGHAEPANSGNSRPVEAINAGLARDIAHQRWSHLSRNPIHPACLSHWASQMGEDGPQRLARLLRLTPGDLQAVLAR